jgi:signal-transduction protein with cAMP-binding, CBS, and nucleotidyltransferase domain
MNAVTVRLMKKKASQFSLFDGLSVEQVERLLQLSLIVAFNENEIVLDGSKKTLDVFMILSGKCMLVYTCSNASISPRILSANNIFGLEVLFNSSALTNKVKAITELICLKINVHDLKTDQDLLDRITPNLMRCMMRRFSDAEDRTSVIRETIQKIDEVVEDRVEPKIIIDKLSKLTRLKLHSGRIVVVSSIDLRRMRRDHITAQQLNDEYFEPIAS